MCHHFRFHQVQGHHYSLNNRLGAGWAARDEYIDGDDRTDSVGTDVGVGEQSATDGAHTHCHHDLGVRGGIISLEERVFHVAGHWSGDQKHVGEARRGNDLQTEPFNVVYGVGERVDFDLTGIA